LNEAFIIEKEIKDQLVLADCKSEEIIKPFLSGRDIKKYKDPENEKFLIFTRRGIQVEKYSEVLKHLEKHRKRLLPKPKEFTGKKWEGRKPGSYKWYEIQDAVDYHEKFELNKIVWPETSQDNQFCFVRPGIYLNKTCFFIPSNDFGLLGILNSSIAKFYFNSIVSKMRGGYFSMSKVYVETFPVVYNPNLHKEISKKVIQLLEKKVEEMDASRLKIEIDQLVYGLYGLTEEEIGIVENN